jgi:uncharacterized membrane protein YcaP (DUF421 family)
MNAQLSGLLIIALKSITIYVFIVAAIRIFGKKELAQLSVIDLVFILLISNSVQNAMVGNDNSLLGGIAAAMGLFIINYIFKWLLKRFPGFGAVVQGKAVMLVYKGKVLNDNMDHAMLTKDELDAAVREHGVNSCSDVDLAILEADGNISVLSKDFAQKSTRKRRAHKVISKNN